MFQPKIVAVAALAATTVVAAPLVHADTRLALNGIRPPPPPANMFIGGGVTPEEYAAFTPQIGANWLPGTTPVVVDYPATAGLPWGLDAPTVDESAAAGQTELHTAIVTAGAEGEPVVVAGLSEGSIVVDRELAYLATAEGTPPADKLTFVLMASPSRGVASLFAPGTYIPVYGYTTQPIPETKYDVAVVFTEYDGWADFPDRPWNLVSVANALMGAGYLHAPTALADRSQAVEVSRSTNAEDGTTTTYMIPTEQLPLTRSLREAGVPTSVTDPIDDVVRPVVDAGYSRNDTGPIRAPYVTQGRIVVPTPEISLSAAPSADRASVGPRREPARAASSTPNAFPPRKRNPLPGLRSLARPGTDAVRAHLPDLERVAGRVLGRADTTD